MRVFCSIWASFSYSPVFEKDPHPHVKYGYTLGVQQLLYNQAKIYNWKCSDSAGKYANSGNPKFFLIIAFIINDC